MNPDQDPIPGAPDAADPPAAEPADGQAPLSTGPDDDVRLVTEAVPWPSGWSDPPTGTDGPRYWDRLILSESARVARYKRKATVVLVEVVGFDKLATPLTPQLAETTLAAAARSLSKEIRTSDYIARLEPFRFGVLLSETTEIEAINFIERARTACERDLRAASDAIGIAFGWAGPPKDGDLSDAMTIAAERLATEVAEH